MNSDISAVTDTNHHCSIVAFFSVAKYVNVGITSIPGAMALQCCVGDVSMSLIRLSHKHDPCTI